MAAGGNTLWARFNIVCGTNGTGKSTFVGEVIKKTHFKNTLVYLESIDLGGTQFKGLPVVDLADYAGGKACIDSDGIGFTDFLIQVTKYYRNGMVVIDEAGLYNVMEKGEVIEPLKNLLKQRRKYNIEVYLIYHSVSEIPVRLLKWCNNIILFHQTDKFNHKGAVIPRIDELNAAKLRIEQKYFAGDHYNCERIQLS